MVPEPINLTRQALALTPEERIRLIECLMESLSEPIDGTVLSDWASEVESRIDRLENGDLSGRPAEDFLRELRQKSS